MATLISSSSSSSSISLLLQNPNPNHLHHTTLSIRLPPKPQLKTLLRSSPKSFKISASNLPQSPLITSISSSDKSQIADSTRTISAVLALTLAAFRSLALRIKALTFTPTPSEFAAIQSLNDSLVCTVGPMFFAAIRTRPSGALNTPLTVVAAGLSKWLDIYSGVLLVRVLLSWFPNIPWDRQPLSAIRDLCDPYLNLFRNIIPPIFDTLDVSPLLAFAVLGALATLLKNSTGL